MAEIVIKLVNGELAGKTVQSIAKEVNAAALAAKKAEVGTQGWIDAHARLDKAKGLQADLKRQVDSTTKASDSLKGSFMGILNRIPGFQSLTSALGGMKGGVGGLTSGFGLLRGAIIATGLGALLILVVGLISYFTKTEKGANMIGGAFKALGAIVDTLLSRLWNIGDTLKQLALNPVKFFMDLGKDIKDAAVEGYNLVQLFDALEDAKRDLELTNAQTESSVERLLLQSRNVALSFKERMALLEQASKLEKDQFDARVKYANEYLLAVGREAAAAEKSGVMNDELADKLQQARIEVINLDKESIALQEKIANRRSQLVEKQEAENERVKKAREKQLEDEQKAREKQLENELNARKNIEDLKIQIMEDGIQKEIAEIELETDRKIEALVGSSAQILEQKLLLETAEQIAIAELIDKYAAEKAAKDKKNREDQEKRDKESNDKRIEEEKRYHDFKFQVEQESFNSSSDIQGAFIDILSADEKSRKRHAQVIKALQLGSITTSLAAEISAIWEYANKNPANALFPGAASVIAVVKTIAATARAGAALGKVNAAKFELGGLLAGPRHRQGGIPIEAEGGEFIFSRKAVQGIGVNNLSRLNSQFTKQYAAGGPVNPFSDRSPIASGKASGSQVMIDNSALINEIRGLRMQVGEWPTKLKVYVSAREVNDAIKTEAQIKGEADV